MNYTYYSGDSFLRDPDFYGTRANPSAPQGTYIGQLNVPYTYPDLHNMALAMVRSDGTVLMPSFHRPWLFNPSNSFQDSRTPTGRTPRAST